MRAKKKGLEEIISRKERDRRWTAFFRLGLARDNLTTARFISFRRRKERASSLRCAFPSALLSLHLPQRRQLSAIFPYLLYHPVQNDPFDAAYDEYVNHPHVLLLLARRRTRERERRSVERPARHKHSSLLSAVFESGRTFDTTLPNSAHRHPRIF